MKHSFVGEGVQVVNPDDHLVLRRFRITEHVSQVADGSVRQIVAQRKEDAGQLERAVDVLRRQTADIKVPGAAVENFQAASSHGVIFKLAPVSSFSGEETLVAPASSECNETNFKLEYERTHCAKVWLTKTVIKFLWMTHLMNNHFDKKRTLYLYDKGLIN